MLFTSNTKIVIMSLIFDTFIVTSHKVLLLSERDEPGLVYFLIFNDVGLRIVS